MEYHAHPIRWLFVGVMWIGIFTHEFTSTSYTIVNNVVTSYFNKPPGSTDVLGVIGMFSGAAFLLVAVIFLRFIKFRAQILSASTLSIVGIATACLGFVNRKTYWMVLVGQVLIGISGGLFHAIPLTMAASWFLTSESATVIGIAWNADSLGVAISSVLFPVAFQNTTQSNIQFISSSEVRQIFMESFLPLCFLLCISTVIVCLFSRNNPPSPPSLSQENYLQLEENTRTQEQNLMGNFTTALEPFKNLNVVLILIVRSLGCSIFALSVPLISSMMLGTFHNMSDSYPGAIRIVGALLSSIGSIVVGWLLDYSKFKKEITVVCVTGMLICAVGVFIGHLFGLVYLVTISYPSANMFNTLVGVCCTELILEMGYPSNPFILISWFHITTGVSVFSYSVIIRSLMEIVNDASAAALPAIASCLALVLVTALRSDYRRSKTEEQGVI